MMADYEKDDLDLVDIEDIKPQPLGVFSVQIKAEVVHKALIRTAGNSSSGPFYKILLGDGTGVVYMCIYLHLTPPSTASTPSPKYTKSQQAIVDHLEVGSVYIFKARVRAYDKNYTVQTHQNGSELVLEELLDDGDPQDPIKKCHRYIPFQFSTAEEVREEIVKKPVDVSGIVVGIDSSRSSQEDLEKFVQLRIEGQVFFCNVWKPHSAFFEGMKIGTKIAVQGAKTLNWDNIRRLHFGNTATIYKMKTARQRFLQPDQKTLFFRSCGLGGRKPKKTYTK